MGLYGSAGVNWNTTTDQGASIGEAVPTPIALPTVLNNDNNGETSPTESDSQNTNKPVAPGDRGTYTGLKNQKKSNGQTEPVEMHEMPSYAAKKEAFFREHGRYPQTPAEKRMVRDQGVSEAVTPEVHSKTDTWRGRNTKTKYQKDADDLNAAQRKDEIDLEKAKQ